MRWDLRQGRVDASDSIHLNLAAVRCVTVCTANTPFAWTVDIYISAQTSIPARCAMYNLASMLLQFVYDGHHRDIVLRLC